MHETRKTLLCQALMSEPELLILDEPFDGLDVQSRAQLADLLASLNQQGYTLVLVLNRFDEIPDFVQNAGVLADCSLTETMKIGTAEAGVDCPTGAQRKARRHYPARPRRPFGTSRFRSQSAADCAA